jgi:plastocyanin
MNQDAATHTIVSDAGSPESFSSDVIANGVNYSFTFPRAGTYAYHCLIHPFMNGTVIVQ